MKLAKLYDLGVKVSSYKDKNGDNKAKWENIGAVFKTEDGSVFMSLKATFNPAAIKRKENDENILVSMFKPKQQNNYNNNDDEYEEIF